jgi:hypothetical protein
LSRVGVYKVDITPPLGIDFIGYQRPTGINNIDENIFVTAFVFEINDSKSVFISVDNIGMLVEDTEVMRKQISKELEIPTEQIIVVYTHTHSGPATASAKKSVKSYKDILINNVVKAAVLADKNLQPSEIGWNVTLGELGINRRENTPDGKVIMGTNPNGPVDKRVGILAIRNEKTKKLAGLIIFCTAHPNVLKGDSDILSADYPGLTREILEKILNCTVIVVQGASGNINALYRGSLDALEKMAYALSGYVLTMLPTVKFEPIKTLKTVSTTLLMRLKEIPEPPEIHNMAKIAEKEWGVNTDRWHSVILDKHKQNEIHLSINVEIQSFQINDGSFTGIPMEPFSETAIEFKDKLSNKLAFFGGYTNGYLGYLPTREAFPEGGYEVELNPVVYGPITNLWMPPAENTVQLIVEKALDLFEK